jgi:hypothetical protein
MVGARLDDLVIGRFGDLVIAPPSRAGVVEGRGNHQISKSPNHQFDAALSSSV